MRCVLYRKVLVEKEGYFLFDWMPNNAKALRLSCDVEDRYNIFEKILLFGSTQDKMGMISDIVSVKCKREVTHSPTIYDPRTFTPRCMFVVKEKNGAARFLRAGLSTDIISTGVPSFYPNSGYYFSDLIEIVVRAVRREI